MARRGSTTVCARSAGATCGGQFTYPFTGVDCTTDPTGPGCDAPVSDPCDPNYHGTGICSPNATECTAHPTYPGVAARRIREPHGVVLRRQIAPRIRLLLAVRRRIIASIIRPRVAVRARRGTAMKTLARQGAPVHRSTATRIPTASGCQSAPDYCKREPECFGLPKRARLLQRQPDSGGLCVSAWLLQCEPDSCGWRDSARLLQH